METVVDKQEEEGAAVVMYKVYTFEPEDINGSIMEHKFSLGEDCAGWFLTKDEAWADYNHCKQLAGKKLAEIEKQLSDLRGNLEFDLCPRYPDYSLHRQGFSPDKLHLSVVIGLYRFYREVYVS